MSKQNLIEKRAQAVNEMRTLMERNSGVLSADEEQQYNRAQADYTKAQEGLKRLEYFQRMAGDLNEAKEQRQESKPVDVAKAKKQAFVRFMQGGRGNLRSQDLKHAQFEQRGTDAQKTTPDSAGGFLIDEVLADAINLGKAFTSEIERVCTVVTTQTGQPINFPKINDTATDGAIYLESARDSAAIPVADMTVGNTQLGSYFYSSKWVKLTIEAAQDIEYSLESWLMPLLAERVNRAKNAQLTTGTGTNQPNGIITAATVGKTAASATAFTHEELIDLFYSVDRAYRMGDRVGWMMNDAVEAAALKLGLTAAENFNPVVIAADGALRIMGKPVYSNADMASTIEADAKTILFGDFSQYVIRKAGAPAMIFSDQQFIQSGQYGYMMYERVDADYVGAVSAIKVLQQAAV